LIGLDDHGGRSSPPESPLLVTRRIRLRTIEMSDYAFLYAAATDPSISYRWRYRGGTPSPETFAADLWQGVLAQFLVERRETGQPVGLQTAYQADLANRTCYLAMMADQIHTGSGLLLEGALLFVDYLFSTWDLRRIYAEVPGYTFNSFKSGVGRYFVEEGKLSEHSYHAGQYWDLHLLAISRDRWNEAANPMLGVLRGQ
jgi:RimJ/RimL family protein N-acetyltransferase